MESSHEYKYLEFPPYVSKSTLKAFKGCLYRFKKTYIDKVDFTPNMVMAEGISLHQIYDRFFDLLDYETLVNLEWAKEHDSPYSQVYNFFLSVISVILPENFKNIHIINNVKSFCRMEENHWFNIRSHEKNRSKWLEYFKPISKEKFFSNEQYQLFGTIDRINREEKDGVLIIDYKTGNVPLPVKRDGAKELPGQFVMEGNLYCILYLLGNGYILDEQGDFYKDGVKVRPNLEYSIIFTNTNPAIVCRKKMSKYSIKSIMKNTPIVRNYQGPWDRQPNITRCRVCPLFATDCVRVLPNEVYGDILRNEDSPSSDVEQ